MLNLAGMLNWVHELPEKKDKEIFEFALSLVRKNNQTDPEKRIKILEIGTYVGFSLINILNRIPNSVGYAVDNWSISQQECKRNETNLKEVFLKNLVITGLQDRVKVYEGDSVNILVDFIKDKTKFDFIYVDGSHLCLETYSDLILAWNCLEVGGIFAIDDYLWNQFVGTVLTRPKEAVDHFLLKFKKEYEIINLGYRVFLKKI